jgi:hypothetical protein
MKTRMFVRVSLGLAVMFCLGLTACAGQGGPTTGELTGPWSAWQGHMRATMDRCVAAKENACLALAFKDRPRPPIDNPRHTVSGDLLYDLRTAEAMLAIPNVADALWREYGIDTVAYLGTGYSVPLMPGGAVAPYWQGTQREYFVPNLCAEAIDSAICPAADPDVWTWRLTSVELKAALDRPIAAILKGDTRTLRARVAGAARPDGLPNALVRFALINPANYKGTFGRVDAKRVFFADYVQVSSKSLREALIATGASTLIGNPDPNQAFFLWIYAPGTETKAAAASWHAVFEALEAN